MEDYLLRADRIIRLPILNLKRLDPVGKCELDSELLDLLQECCEKSNWTQEIAKCRQEYKAARFKLSPKAESLMKGICCICGGTAQCGEKAWSAAAKSYRQARRIFEDEDYEYGLGIALVALGLTHQVDNEYTEARRLYDQSRQVFERLDQEYRLWHGTSKESPYRGFCRQLHSMIRRAEAENARQLPIINLVGEATAGMPLYLPGEQYQGPIDAVVLEGGRYRVLSLESRQPTKIDLGVSIRDQEYLVVKASGDSMIEARIFSGDYLLVRKQDGEPENGQIAVFQDEDQRPIVKIFRREGDRRWLQSANPKYLPLTVTPTMRAVGVVVAYLERLQE